MTNEENNINLHNHVLDIACKIGINLLKSGAEVGRVEKTVTYICEAYGATKVDVFSLPTLILLSAEFEGNDYTSKIKRNDTMSIDLYRIEKYNALSREITSKHLDLDEVDERIKEIENKKDYRLFFNILGSYCCAFGFAMFFGGTLLDAFISGFIGLLTYVMNYYKPKRANQIVHTLICSLIGGMLAYLASICGIIDNLGCVMIGAIMLLIPGIMISTSIRDILIDDVLSGSIKLFQAIATSLAIAAGYSIWTVLYKNPVTINADPSFAFMLIGGAIGTLGFSIIFNSKYKKLGFALIGGILTTLAYILCIKVFNLNAILSNFIAALFGGVYAEIMARIVKSPNTSFILPSIVPLVPGAALFFTMYNLINYNSQNMLSSLGSVLIGTLSIALGLVVSTVIFRFFKRNKA